MIRSLYAALRFLTQLPWPDPGSLTHQELGRVPLFYPLAGLLIGFILSVFSIVLTPYPSFLAAAIILAIWIGLTGVLHLDGLADSADAWVGGLGNRERTLAIMKDPCSGPAGVTAIVLILLLKFAALQALLIQIQFGILLWPPLFARVGLTALLLTTPYVRPGGLGEGVARYLVPREALFAIIIPIIGIIAILGWKGVVLLFIGLVGFWGIRRAFCQCIGGTTGDTAGALVELLETLILIGACL